MAEQQQVGAAGRLSVLIVDDNRDLADSLSLLMRLWGFDVCVAYDGPSGLEVARVQRPDCALLDIGLPRLDGYQLARQIRQTPGLEKTKLIAHTAYTGDEHARQAEEAGFDYRMTKPADPGQLEGTLRMMEQVKRLAEQTEELVRRNVALAGEAKDILTEVKEDIKEVKEDLKEVKQELKEVKEKIEDADAKGE